MGGSSMPGAESRMQGSEGRMGNPTGTMGMGGMKTNESQMPGYRGMGSEGERMGGNAGMGGPAGMQGNEMKGSGMKGTGMQGNGNNGNQRGEGRREYGMQSSEPGSTSPGAPGDMENVLVEVRLPDRNAKLSLLDMSAGLEASGFQVDTNYEPVPMVVDTKGLNRGLSSDGSIVSPEERTMIVRGKVEASRIAELERQPNVIKVWKDSPIAPFQFSATEDAVAEPIRREKKLDRPFVLKQEAFATCPIGTCDCDPGTPKGGMAEVAAYLGVDQIWNAGYRGEGIVVGVVDGGITAQGRPINQNDLNDPGWPNKLVPRVIGGFPTADWGTTGFTWGWHGNMCSTDVLGMAPNAQVYDIRIAESTIATTISAALAGFQWSIDQHRIDGTPHILTNSWGMFQKAWDTAYATDPNHPFTRKVVEALDEGILVLFAAGNCGGTCPDGRCSTDNGPGKSIWGANGHSRVMTVGAVNKDEKFVGYSSQGPAALDQFKPDFCSITHFTGFFNSDSGTSAATPICAGVVALLKQANPALGQEQAKTALKSTAKDIGPAGFDFHSGAGIIRPKLALDTMIETTSVPGPVVSWGSDRLDAFVIGTDRALYHKWWDGSNWGPGVTGYEYMGGVIQGRPEVISWDQNRLDVFVKGTDHALYHKWFDGAGWGPSVTGYEFMGGIIQGHPRVVSWAPNRLDVFVKGTDNALYHKWFDGAGWGPSATGYEFLGGIIQGSPEVVSWGKDRLDIFVVGTDGALYHKWFGAGGWGPSITGYEYMGGIIVGQPKVVSWGPNRLDVFVIGTDSALYHKWWDGANWGPSLTGWEYMGGTIIGNPEVVSWGANRLDVFVTGTDSALYHKWFGGGGWGPSITDYEYMGGVLTGDPRVVSWGANRLDVFVTGTDSALYHKWFGAGGWGPSVTGYEYMGGVITDF